MDMDAEIKMRYEHKNIITIVVGIVLAIMIIASGIVGYDSLMLSYGYEYRQIPTGQTTGAWVKAIHDRENAKD